MPMPATRAGSVESRSWLMTCLRFASTPEAPFQASVCTSRRPRSSPSPLRSPPRSLLPPRSMPTALRSEGTSNRAAGCESGAAGRSGLLVFVLLRCGRRLVHRVRHALLELLHARSEGTGETGQLVGPEEDQDDHEDDQQLLHSQPKHGAAPFLC